MYLMILVLNKTEMLDTILEKLYQTGITGATIYDSHGMGRTICDKLTLFGGWRNMFTDCRPGNKTIMSVVENEEMVEKALSEIEEIIGDLEMAGQGIFFTIPLHQVKGLV